jgi:hypothetical protein
MAVYIDGGVCLGKRRCSVVVVVVSVAMCRGWMAYLVVELDVGHVLIGLLL